MSFTRALDAQRAEGKAIFGAGFLLSQEATARKVEAEGAAAEHAAENLRRLAAVKDDTVYNEDGCVVWPLTDRELEIVAQLGKRPADG